MTPAPGQPSSKAQVARMLRVDLAGEYGAKRIYDGQLAILKDSPVTPLIEHMREQELNHLKSFEAWVVENRVRPTLLYPLWHVAGYALGMGTALLGERAAMACTAAVEEVIDQHYEQQLVCLGSENPELSQLIQTCQAEEQEHRELALQEGAEDTPAYPILSRGIKAASRLAIWLSERV